MIHPNGRSTPFPVSLEFSEPPCVPLDRSEKSLLVGESIPLERAILRLLTDFISLSLDEIDAKINESLQLVGEFEKSDRSYVFLFNDTARTRFRCTHEWCTQGVSAEIDSLQDLDTADFPQIMNVLEKQEPFYVPDVSALGEDTAERASLQAQSIQSLIIVPIAYQRSLLGFVGFDSVRQQKYWSESSIHLLTIFAEMIANALHRKNSEELLRQHQHQTTRLLNSLPGIVFKAIALGDFPMKFLSDGCYRLTGYQPEELQFPYGKPYKTLIHGQDYDRVVNTIERSLQERGFYAVEYRIITKDGQQKWLWEQGALDPNCDRHPPNIEGFITDITRRKMAEAALRESEESLRQAEEQYRNIFENITQGIFQTSQDGHYLKANPALARIYGYDSPEDLIAQVTNVETQLYVDQDRRARFQERLASDGGTVFNFESKVYRADGSIVWISENTRAVGDSQGNFLYYEGTVEDITYRRRAEEELLRHAFYDSLTGLHNRAWFIGELQKAIETVDRCEGFHYAVLFIDLDGFKVINDSFGHLVGDELLRQVGRKFQSQLRATDKIARFGGDEFAILLENIPSTEEAIAVACRLQESLRLPFQPNGETVFIGASIGITTGDRGYQGTEEPIRDADIAMYRAKADGKARYALFSPEMQTAILSRLHTENDLRLALQNREFHLHYQPIISLPTGTLTGFEALLRWTHPTRGMISPAEFIPIAEETGLIHSIGWWVLQEACYQLSEWKSLYPIAGSLTMNVNLSAQQLKETGLVKHIDHLLRKTGLDGNQLKLEITESALLETIASKATIVEQLKSFGLQLCIDDFGTGYSSLSRLHEFPIDTLKIDRSFIRGLETNQAAIVQMILSLAHTLGMNVVAEGIETPTQLEKLKCLGCEFGQGYFFSTPVPESIARSFIEISCPFQSSINQVAS
jgi:diguanylate cyclase (GGDEF)-like protein/PAS domain S-box-containing protein